MFNFNIEALFGSMSNFTVLLAENAPVELVKEPNVVMKPFVYVLGNVFDSLFNIVSGVFDRGSLGVTIILLTIVVRLALIPFAAHSAKSMSKMSLLKPEMDKIKKKYKGKTDQESRQRMNAEMTELQRKSGVNPLNGCLPLLLQMPIIFALFELLRKTYVYVDKLGQIYTEMANIVLKIPDIGPKMYEIVKSSALLKSYVAKDASFDLSFSDNCREVLSKLSEKEWATVISNAPAEIASQITPLLEQKANIEYFCGINLVEKPEFWPLSAISISILIPILSGLTTFLSTKMMNKAQAPATDEQAIMQQRMMLYMMPLLMVFMAFTLPAGLGLYWTVGNIIQIGQQAVFNKLYYADKKA